MLKFRKPEDSYSRIFADELISNGFNLNTDFSFNEDTLKQNIIK